MADNLTAREKAEALRVPAGMPLGPRPSPPPGRRPATPTSTAAARSIAAAPKAPAPAGGKNAPRAKSAKESRAENAATTLGLLSTACMLGGLLLSRPVLLDDAGALSIHAEPVGASLAEFAETNDFLAGIMDRLELVNGAAVVVVATMPLALQLMVNHRATTEQGKARVEELAPTLLQFGVLPPDALREKTAAEHRTKVAKLQADLLTQQREAEDELAGLRESMTTAGASA